MADALTKAALGSVVGLQSVALLGQNLKLLPRQTRLKNGRVKFTFPKSRNLAKLGVSNLVGVALITPTAKMINDL